MSESNPKYPLCQKSYLGFDRLRANVIIQFWSKLTTLHLDETLWLDAWQIVTNQNEFIQSRVVILC